MSDEWCTCLQRDANGEFSRGPRPREECQVLREFGDGRLNNALGRSDALQRYRAELQAAIDKGSK